MSEQEIYERLNEVFRNVFDDDDIEVEAGTTADDIEDWDSLEHINLISAVEDEFGIRFKMGEVSSMKNVGEMVDIIKSRPKPGRAAVSRFKFRLWNCRRSTKISRTAGLNKEIIDIMWVAVSRFRFRLWNRLSNP